jgi:hypothetical protein
VVPAHHALSHRDACHRSDNRKELEKAIHTKNQKLLWNSFMEMRISFQQMLTLANRYHNKHSTARPLPLSSKLVMTWR